MAQIFYHLKKLDLAYLLLLQFGLSRIHNEHAFLSSNNHIQCVQEVYFHIAIRKITTDKTFWPYSL